MDTSNGTIADTLWIIIKRILSSININNKDIVNLDKTVNGAKYIKFEEKKQQSYL